MMAEPDRPNILFIMDDQHRFDWLGCAGADWVRTPNLDRLAARGVRFANAFTNSPVCVPARVALACGLQPCRTGVLNNQGFLPRGTPTYYQRLRDSGYRVGLVGKLHMAKPREPYSLTGDRPVLFSYGFTHTEEHVGKVGSVDGGAMDPYGARLERKGLMRKLMQDYATRRKEGWPAACNDSVLDTEDFHDHVIGRRGAEWISEVPDDYPWHCFVSFGGPHHPFDPPSEFAARYRDAAMPPAIADEAAAEHKPSRTFARMKSTDSLPARRQYAALIELVDRRVGDMMDALERRGMLDNTVVVFTSDHGEMLGDHRLWAKRVMYEGSLRVPLIVAGPGIAGGRVSNALVELLDLNATLCDLAGLPAQSELDTRSFGAVLRGEAEEHRSEVVSYLDTCQCVRDRRYKAILNAGQSDELYDLEQDPDELRNILEEQPQIYIGLRDRMRARFWSGASPSFALSVVTH